MEAYENIARLWKKLNLCLLLLLFTISIISLLVGIGIGINEAQEKRSQLGFIQAREKTEARCADWSKAHEVSEATRGDGVIETLYACNGYKFYFVSSWNIYHSDVSVYDTNIIKEIINGKRDTKT